MLECPNCGEFFTPVNLKTTGGSITVDHCINCGGSWFDPYEINRITTKDVYILGQSLLIKKNEVPWGKMERLCPRDFHELQKEKSEISIEHISMERCPECKGIFIMQADLAKLKSAQTTKIATYKSLSLPFSLNSVLIPFVFVSLLMLSTFMTITNLDDAQNSQIKAQEELKSVKSIPITDSTVAILFLTNSNTITYIEYQTNILDQKKLRISDTPSKTHQITLTNLKPGTKYTYYILIQQPNGEMIRSKAYNFTTK